MLIQLFKIKLYTFSIYLKIGRTNNQLKSGNGFTPFIKNKIENDMIRTMC